MNQLTKWSDILHTKLYWNMLSKNKGLRWDIAQFCCGGGERYFATPFIRKNTFFEKSCSHPLKLVYVTIEILCKKIGPFNQHLGGATTLSSLTLKSLCPRLGNHEICKKKGVIWFFSFVFIAESDSGGDFTVRKTYKSPIFHIYINVGENLFLGVLIDSKITPRIRFCNEKNHITPFYTDFMVSESWT